MNTPESSLTEDAIDLRELFYELWKKKHVILMASAMGIIAASIYAFLIAKPIYESSALLLPTQSNNPDQLGAAAALLGKKSGSNADVALYQSLLTSRTVIHKLINSPVKHTNTEIPLYKAMGVDTNTTTNIEPLVNLLTHSISIETKTESDAGILEIHFEAGSPWLAQKIGENALEIGQRELLKIRYSRANLIIERLKNAIATARKEWEISAQAVALYKDRNRSILLPDQHLELARLEMEKNSKEQKLLLAKKEFEIQNLELEKSTPPVIIIDSPDLPVRKIRPMRSLLLFAGLSLGFIGSCLAILAMRFLFK